MLKKMEGAKRVRDIAHVSRVGFKHVSQTYEQRSIYLIKNTKDGNNPITSSSEHPRVIIYIYIYLP